MELKELEDLLRENPDGVELVCFDGKFKTFYKSINVVGIADGYFIIGRSDTGFDTLFISILTHFKPHEKYKEKSMEFKVGDIVRYAVGTTELVGVLESARWGNELKVNVDGYNYILFNSKDGSPVIGSECKLVLIKRPKKKEKRYNLLLKHNTTRVFRLSDIKYAKGEEPKYKVESIVKHIEESEEEFEVEG